jgi:hypothetical protein
MSDVRSKSEFRMDGKIESARLEEYYIGMRSEQVMS